MSNVEALIILNAIPGLGNRRITKLIEYFKSPLEILSASEMGLIRAQVIPQSVVRSMTEFPKEKFLSEEKDLIQKNNIC